MFNAWDTHVKLLNCDTGLATSAQKEMKMFLHMYDMIDFEEYNNVTVLFRSVRAIGNHYR